MKPVYFLVFMFLALPVSAEVWEYPSCDSDSEYAKFANECDEDKFEANTNTENGDEAGGGADVVIWQNDNKDALFEEFVAEYRYDTRSKNQEVYGVLRINLWSKIKKFFGK